jgi:hypothetical protein
MTWLGHEVMIKRLRYVHVADVHRRDRPADILAAAQGGTLNPTGAHSSCSAPGGCTASPIRRADGA